MSSSSLCLGHSELPGTSADRSWSLNCSRGYGVRCIAATRGSSATGRGPARSRSRQPTRWTGPRCGVPSRASMWPFTSIHSRHGHVVRAAGPRCSGHLRGCRCMLCGGEAHCVSGYRSRPCQDLRRTSLAWEAWGYPAGQQRAGGRCKLEDCGDHRQRVGVVRDASVSHRAPAGDGHPEMGENPASSPSPSARAILVGAAALPFSWAWPASRSTGHSGSSERGGRPSSARAASGTSPARPSTRACSAWPPSPGSSSWGASPTASSGAASRGPA